MAKSLLRDRLNARGDDVAQAIENILTAGMVPLPVAIVKTAVVEELIQMASTDAQGVYISPPLAVHSALYDKYTARLVSESEDCDYGTSVFQSGYTRYEKGSRNPVVPVSKFFFSDIWGNGDTADVLDAMTDEDIRHSIPGRSRRVPITNPDGTAGYLRDADGHIALVSYPTVGIVIFPPVSEGDAMPALLAAWQRWGNSVTVGQIEAQTGRLGFAQPALRRKFARPVASITHQLTSAVPDDEEPI